MPQQHLRAWLEAMGLNEDPEMAETAERVTAFFQAYRPCPPPALSRCAASSPDPVAVRAIPFASICAHHLLPFFGQVSIALLPGDTLLGLGAYPTVVTHFARRPTLQERMTAAVADHLWEASGARAVAVRVTARHLCVEMRGHPGTPAVATQALRGEGAIGLLPLLDG
jgi:GTP cyclohydrolase I